MVTTGDEVLDYREAVAKYVGAKQLVVQGSDHGFAEFEQLPGLACWSSPAPVDCQAGRPTASRPRRTRAGDPKPSRRGLRVRLAARSAIMRARFSSPSSQSTTRSSRMNVFYEEEGTFKVGAVLADNDTSLQVEAPHGKRSKVKAGNVLFRFDGAAGELSGSGAEIGRGGGRGLSVGVLRRRRVLVRRRWRATTMATRPARWSRRRCCCACTARRCTSTRRARAATGPRRPTR